MTYSESAALMIDMDFRGRVKTAMLHFAGYVMGEDPGTTAHNSRYKFAQLCFQQPDMQASNLQPVVVMDANVQSAGSAIDDNTLQTAVEAAIGKII